MRRSRPDVKEQPYYHADGGGSQEHDRHLPSDDLEQAGLQASLGFAIAAADRLGEKLAQVVEAIAVRRETVQSHCLVRGG